MEIYAVENLNFTYAGAKAPSLSNVSFTVDEGELVLLCGASGSGKSTLLSALKPLLTPAGKTTGTICFCGENLCTLDERRAAAQIGFCMQSPEHQQVCDTVEREIAFGLECIGTKPETAAKRIAEAALFFGIEKLLWRKLSELSGGEKQKVNMAAICALHPKVLLLDEPTAQLSPVAAAELYALLLRMRRELGMTVIMAAHRTEEIFESADRIILLDSGRVVLNAPPEKAQQLIINSKPQAAALLPSPARLYRKLNEGEPPLTMAQGREYLRRHADSFVLNPRKTVSGKTVLECKSVGFAYTRTSTVLYNLSFSAARGEFFCVLGANGAGKTTLLKLLAGIYRPVTGRIKTDKGLRTAYLPQNAALMLTGDTLRESLGKKGSEKAAEFGLSELLERHPYDLSGGEMQRAALCLLLSGEPDILLLDEPTKGIDSAGREKLAQMLSALCRQGKTVICATHDVEFAAQCADRAAFLSGGTMPSPENVTEFFAGNVYCSPAANRLTRGIIEGCVSLDELEVRQ